MHENSFFFLCMFAIYRFIKKNYTRVKKTVSQSTYKGEMEMAELRLEHIYKMYDKDVTAVKILTFTFKIKNLLYLLGLPAAGNPQRFVWLQG